MESGDEADPDYQPSSSSSHEDEVVTLKTFSATEPEVVMSCSVKNIRKERKLESSKQQSQVTVKMSRNKPTARVWDKAHYCLYCKKSNLKMARHLERKHSEDVEVAHAISLPVGSKQRKIEFEAICNKGDWEHNLQVLKDKKGELVTWRQPPKEASAKDYLPCQHGFGMFKRTELWRHEHSCRQRTPDIMKGKRSRVQKASSQLIPSTESSDGVQNIIHNMLQDKVTTHIRNDDMICAYGDLLFSKKACKQSQHRYIAHKMRELGRFVVTAMELDKTVKGLKDVCDPTKFQLAIKAARKVGNFNETTTEHGNHLHHCS